MIKFTAKLTVKKIEKKSITKRDGGIFEFEEIVLEHNTKKPTTIVARAMDDIRPRIQEGITVEMDVAISSREYNGRVFNSFLIVDMAETTQPAPKVDMEDFSDDLPF